jgi:hypothetical protein
VPPVPAGDSVQLGEACESGSGAAALARDLADALAATEQQLEEVEADRQVGHRNEHKQQQTAALSLLVVSAVRVLDDSSVASHSRPGGCGAARQLDGQLPISVRQAAGGFRRKRCL